MTDELRFDGRVAIVTGAGGGLGRAHALGLAARGCRVVVNDLGQSAQDTTDQIIAQGGMAFADNTDITNPDAVATLIAGVMEAWGRVDILINNAGILRDKSFGKQTLESLDSVIDVHLRGSWICAQAVWENMRTQGYGRILFTTSSSGLYGNFGQANYAAAKAAMIGLMNSLHIEGAKHGIRVNCLAPAAATQMTQDLLPEDALKVLTPDSVTPGAVFLVSEHAPSKVILGAGAGVFSVVKIEETPGIALGASATAEDVADQWAKIAGQPGAESIDTAWAQTAKFIARASALRPADD